MTGEAGMAGIKGKTTVITAVALAAMVSSLAVYEGSKQVPYRDSGGVWTVCKGITGQGVIPGKRYSAAECEALETAYVERMSADIGKCLGVPLAVHEWVAWGHFAYNIGTPRFCNSTAARMIREGQNEAACNQIPRWRYVNGKDCNIRSSNCYGIIRRRAWERSMCLGNEDLGPYPAVEAK